MIVEFFYSAVNNKACRTTIEQTIIMIFSQEIKQRARLFRRVMRGSKKGFRMNFGGRTACSSGRIFLYS